jgi:hypothetical protein
VRVARRWTSVSTKIDMGNNKNVKSHLKKRCYPTFPPVHLFRRTEDFLSNTTRKSIFTGRGCKWSELHVSEQMKRAATSTESPLDSNHFHLLAHQFLYLTVPLPSQAAFSSPSRTRRYVLPLLALHRCISGGDRKTAKAKEERRGRHDV